MCSTVRRKEVVEVESETRNLEELSEIVEEETEEF